MKKQLFILALFVTLFSLPNCYAQSYTSSAGLRLGSSNGIVFKHFLTQNSAIELMAGTRWRGFNIVGLYEIHTTVFQNKQFQFYYGAGGHFGAGDNYNDHPLFDDKDDDEYLVIGVDGILGLEYAFSNVPLSLSLDWKPEFNLIGYSGVWVGDSGLSIRYYW